MALQPVPKDFVCWQCGNCCRGKGYVHIGADEVEHMAKHLKTTVNDFLETYTTLGPDRKGLVLTDKPNDDCIFLNPDSTCAVYPVRPRQCAEFPYQWNYRGWINNCDNKSEWPGPGRSAREKTT
ncbi:MAG: YkgJ family cysteine cluster protein [Verrucomicrobia bacterium]|nr:YkgJ family cysteine cluster protein [Verrucomicrobiota bacterium]